MSDPASKWWPTPTGLLMVLRQGNDVLAELEDLTSREAIDGATFCGFGFAGSVTFGFFDYDRKEYVPKKF